LPFFSWQGVCTHPTHLVCLRHWPCIVLGSATVGRATCDDNNAALDKFLHRRNRLSGSHAPRPYTHTVNHTHSFVFPSTESLCGYGDAIELNINRYLRSILHRSAQLTRQGIQQQQQRGDANAIELKLFQTHVSNSYTDSCIGPQ